MPIKICGLELTIRDLERLWSKVIIGPKENDCWGWSDVLSKAGYAYLGIGGRKGKKFLVHRMLYEIVIRPIPEGMDLDHLCRNRFCVRPDHQEPATRRVNLMRGQTLAAKHAAATHCPQGHPYDLFNTRIAPGGGRVCKICSNILHPRTRRARNYVSY